MIPLALCDLDVRFSYDPSTGDVTHKFMDREHFSSGRAFKRHNYFAGKIAGRVNDRGYRQISVDGRKVGAHRVAWVLGNRRPIPEGCEIDHINGDRSDNRLVNLRSVSKSLNQRNAGRRTDNKSGEPSVRLHPKTGKWQLDVRIGSKRTYIGLFSTVEEAASVRDRIRSDNGYLLNRRPSRNLEALLAANLDQDLTAYVHADLNRVKR